MERLTFPNVEAQVVGYLAPLLSVPVVRIIPSTRPASFVRMMLTGTSRRGLAQADARLTVECWATTDAAAEALARQAYGLLCALDLPDGTHVPLGSDGWAGGPYADVDPTSGSPRYVMTVVVRQSAIVLEG